MRRPGAFRQAGYIYMNICKDKMMICLQAHWRAAQAHTNSARQSPTSPKTQKASPTPPAQGTAMRRRDASHKHKHVASRNPDPKSTDEELTMLVASMTEQEEAVCRRLGDGGAGGRVLAIAREVARMHLRVGDGARFRVLSARLGALQVHADGPCCGWGAGRPGFQVRLCAAPSSSGPG